MALIMGNARRPARIATAAAGGGLAIVALLAVLVAVSGRCGAVARFLTDTLGESIWTGDCGSKGLSGAYASVANGPHPTVLRPRGVESAVGDYARLDPSMSDRVLLPGAADGPDQGADAYERVADIIDPEDVLRPSDSTGSSGDAAPLDQYARIESETAAVIQPKPVSPVPIDVAQQGGGPLANPMQAHEARAPNFEVVAGAQNPTPDPTKPGSGDPNGGAQAGGGPGPTDPDPSGPDQGGPGGGAPPANRNDLFAPPGALTAGSGSGSGDETIFAPGIRFPIEEGPAFANSQVWGVGGFRNPTGGQCDRRNYTFPWRDNFCETRGYVNGFCPSGRGHQGQDIRPATCEIDKHWAVAAEDGTISSIGGYTVSLRGDSGREYRYLHLNMRRLPVRVGQRVTRGQRLGLVSNFFGSTPTTIHLHFEIRVAEVGADGRLRRRAVPPYTSLMVSYLRLIDGLEG